MIPEHDQLGLLIAHAYSEYCQTGDLYCYTLYLHGTGLDKLCELVIGEQLDLLHHVFEGALQSKAQRLVVGLGSEGDAILKKINCRVNTKVG